MITHLNESARAHTHTCTYTRTRSWQLWVELLRGLNWCVKSRGGVITHSELTKSAGEKHHWTFLKKIYKDSFFNNQVSDSRWFCLSKGKTDCAVVGFKMTDLWSFWVSPSKVKNIYRISSYLHLFPGVKWIVFTFTHGKSLYMW